MTEYPEERRLKDCRRDVGEVRDISRLDGFRLCEEVGRCVGVRGGDDMVLLCGV